MNTEAPSFQPFSAANDNGLELTQNHFSAPEMMMNPNLGPMPSQNDYMLYPSD